MSDGNATKKYLTDILMCIEGIEFHLRNNRNFAYYQKSPTIKRAVERELTIIGEAVNRILKLDPEFKLSRAKEIIAFRNRVIHAYDAVDDNLVWKIIQKDLPVLRDEILKIISE
jgi:uncharacterized protein with HEPN domain